MSKTATFQFQINPDVRKRAESVYAECGLTLTDAINIFIQQSIDVEGLPFSVAEKSKFGRFERAVARLMSEIDAGETSAASRGWIDESDIAKEFGGST